jgi:predicted transcriptional regulator
MASKKDVAITDSLDAYIDRLASEKRMIEERIRELQAEVRTINNLIYRRKSEIHAGDTGQDRNLKNADRLFFEAVVLDALSNSKRGLRTGEIHSAVTKQGYGLNYNTLRSYVTRMRDKGLIRKKSPTSYYWIAETNPSMPS